MKVFTKFLSVLIVCSLTTAVVFGQNMNVTPSNKQFTDKYANPVKKVLPEVQKKMEIMNLNTSRLVSPYGPNFQAKGELDCPEGSIFDQSCVGYTTGVTSEVDPGYKVFQYYSGVSESIGSITWWGINAWFNGSGWAACTEDPMDFNIEIYGDNGGAPDLGNLLESYTANLDGFETGEFFAGSYEILRYTYEITAGITYTDAWIMIQGGGSTSCWFLWVDSGTPGTLSYQDDGTGPAQTTYVQSLCLGAGGIQYTNDIGIQTILTPNSGPNLGTNEVVSVRIKNYGTAAQSNFNISYTLNGGAPVSATITSSIASGATLDYTFPGTVDLSTYGIYTFVACTYLTGDENTGNDCKTKNVENYPPFYCDATTVYEDEYIASVECGDINNQTGWQGGVADYTSISTTINPGSSQDITVLNGPNIYSTDQVTCWVDWNMNYVFDQGGEEEFILLNVGGTGATFTGAITSPATTPTGDYRLRIRMTYSLAPTPCGESNYGEIEDYTIHVGPPPDNDLSVDLISSPVTGPNLGMENVTVTIANLGLLTQSNFPVHYTINGGTPVSATVAQSIAYGETIEYTFTQQANLTAYGSYNIEACTDLAGDEKPTNDCKSVSVLNYDPTQQCDFYVMLYDDYGDGWNGGALTISVAGTVVLNNITLANGFGPETYPFTVLNGADVVCVFTPGSWAYECSYYIYNNDDEEVFSDGVGGVQPTGGSFVAECVQFVYGTLSGTVTALAGGAPIAGATVTVDDMETLTAANGTYSFPLVEIGTWDVTCTKEGYNPIVANNVTILEGQTTTQNFAMTAPTINVNPLVINVTLEPNAQTDQFVTITNNGNGPLAWEAEIETMSDGKAYGYSGLTKNIIANEEAANADVIAVGTQVPVDQLSNTDIPLQTTYPPIGSGPTDEIDIIGGIVNSYTNGPRTRGNMFTCTTEKLLVEFMGWHAVTTNPTTMWMLVYESDVQVGNYNLVVAVDITPAPIGTGWVSSGVVNYLLQAGKYYMIVASFQQMCGYYADPAVSPFPYPVAFGEATGGAGYSWAPTSNFPPDQTQAVPADVFVEPVLYYQQLVSADPVSWVAIDPTSGDLNAGSNEQMTVHFDATDLLPGVYEADIVFASDPNVGSPVIDVTMTVAGLIPATNLELDFDCTDVLLTWEMPTGGNPDSWNVYRDGVLIGSTTVMSYTDEMVDPEVSYGYYVKAVYAGEESMATSTQNIVVPTPEDLAPLGLEYVVDVPNENDVTLNWDAPDACLAPDGYNIFRDGNQINTSLVTAPTYVDPALPVGLYEYYVTAEFYFGESEPSDAVYTLITGIEDVNSDLFRIYPNPASGTVNIESSAEITGIQVYTSTGQMVMDKVLKTGHYQFDVSNYEKGIYFIKLETSEGKMFRRVTVN